MTGALRDVLVLGFLTNNISILWLHTAHLLHLNHYNDAPLSASLVPSVFGMGPSVLLPAIFFGL